MAHHAEPEMLPPSQYAATLKTAMSEAYDKVREKTARQLKRQSDLYNQKIHGNPYKVGEQVWVLFPQPPSRIKEAISTVEWPFCGG